ncbi:hypothetical protein GCM10027275_42830 [Rhabdobacter roseus]
MAVIKLEKVQVEAITGFLPEVQAIKERHSITTFALKGFPSATKGQELVLTKPEFMQEMAGQSTFQLRLTDDFTTDTSAESKVDGFSGSGVFLESYNKLYLFGLFTRFREAQKIIYCQYIEAINELLTAAFLPNIPFSYIGEYGLTPDFFAKHSANMIKNLGPRFSEQLNLRLPIVSNFHDAARNDTFKRRLLRCIDSWLQRSNSSHDKKKGLLAEIADEHGALRQSTIAWVSAIQWEADKPIDLAPICEGLNTLEKHLDEKQSELYELRRQERQRKSELGEGKRHNHGKEREPYESELQWLRETERALSALQGALREISFTLANSPVLLIKGEPGSGKSHLLGDMANEATKAGVATLLFLGQLFQRGQTIWQNILNQLGLTCTQYELLTSLNSIGRQQGSRVLIMIDALNEGPGRALWKDALAGFIEEVKSFPFVGLVLSVRTTYFNAIIPKNLQKDGPITYRVHAGFQGNEYAALRLFCEHYGLQTPNFPMLAPEFTNPLFLQLLCQGMKASGKKVFPQGFQGVTNVFNHYVDAVYEKLAEKREDYTNRKHIVREAIQAVAKACFEKEGPRMLTIEEADTLFQERFDRYPHLLNDLIHEYLLIQTTQTDYRTETEFEMLYFAFERLGDFFITEQLLGEYTTTAQVRQAFQKDGQLGQLLEGYSWSNSGILDAMAVRLPEKYELEIVEACDWAFGLTDDPHHDDVGDCLTRCLWDSLKWRLPSHIDDKKITAWLRSDQCSLDDDSYLLRLVELTTVHAHPFNSDRLFKFMNQYSMPERDGFWQVHMHHFCHYGEDRNAFPIRRLIDWAWQKGVSASIDSETARLAGQTLAWLLSSTDRQLRDQTTKAMVNLLEEQPDALIRIMQAFINIDDAYIAERLYAVAYGCALRTSTDTKLEQIASYIYTSTFKDGNPPVHVLLRDYARNIVEYAHYKGRATSMDMAVVRPPYQSEFPTVLPSDEEVRQYQNKSIATDSRGEKEKNRIDGQIYFSTITWDFGRYTVESAVRNFAPVSFTTESRFKDFQKTLKGERKYRMRIIVAHVKLKALLEARKAGGTKVLAGKAIEDRIIELDHDNQRYLRSLVELFDAEEIAEINQKFLPFLQAKHADKKYPQDSLEYAPIKYWIVQRAFELGYAIEKHYEYDSLAERHSDHFAAHGNKIERIGKKYQWIALHEILARLGDNYYYKEDRWNSRAQYSFYQGPWQQYLRDIDPIFTIKNPEGKVDEAGSSTRVPLQKGWYFDTEYAYWNQAPSQWVNNKKDLPAPENIILRQDEHGEAWVYLKMSTTWEEPKGIGQDRHNRPRKAIRYLINAYLVRKGNTKKITEWLSGKDFSDIHMPETQRTNASLFNRENYWSPTARLEAKQRKTWEAIPASTHKVSVTTQEAVGEMSGDKSGAHFHYDMPSKILFEGMGLQYAPEDGSFKNSMGQMIVTHINGRGILMRKKELFIFLERSNFDIFWSLEGEKIATTGLSNSENDQYSAISGVYQISENKVMGNLFITKRE